MAVLHGSWLFPEHDTIEQRGSLFLWGETWRRLDEPIEQEPTTVLMHPYAMNPGELLEFLKPLHCSHRLKLPALELTGQDAPKRGRKKAIATPSGHGKAPDAWQGRVVALPTGDDGVPVLSASELLSTVTLHPWRIQGLCLPPMEAFQFLNSLPLGLPTGEDAFLGGALRFWSHVARWTLDLLARSKFLPGLAIYDDHAVARWEVLLDSSTDQARLRQFIRHMPSVCRTYQPEHEALAIQLPPEPKALLLHFLNQIMDEQIRVSATTYPLPNGNAALKPWLQGLSQSTTQRDRSIADLLDTDWLKGVLTTWKTPISSYQTDQFRTCFHLAPPIQNQRTWILEYYLQAVDDPDFVVSAPIIWQNPVEHLVYAGRRIDRPQETLLMGLGLASRLYPLIEPSLDNVRPQSCQLDPVQAYDFIMNAAWRLQDSGLGVILPPSLAGRGGWANRLGLKIRASTPTKRKTDRLGLQSLLNFEWELSIGGHSLSKAQFDRLVAQNMPLVEINGEWVELRSQDIRSAQSFFTARKDQTTLSLDDALRISTGDTQTMEKLPVVSFEASGALHELVTALTGNQTLEELPTPIEFQGELRPYQSRGVAWLAFLEKWGLGACLADDMGLGKTIQFIAFLLHLKQQNLLERPILLVCPTSVLGNWEREVKKFAPTLSAIVHHGDKRLQGHAFAKAAQKNHLIITSYALLHRDLKSLTSVGWQGVVLDEAQNIKNPEAKQSQAVRQFEAEFRIALTGTPVENRLSELWSILDFLNPGYLGPRNFFQRRFAIPIERYGDVTSLQTLRSLVQPFILRRLKSDRTIIQDLPEKQEMTVFCGLSAEQAALYQAIVDRSLEEIEAAQGIQRKGIILALLTKLKQVCNHPVLVNAENSQASTRSFRSQSAKLQRLEEMLDEAVAEGDRAIVFTQFAEWGKLLKSHLEEQLEREVLYLYGGTSKKQREAMIDRFQHDPQAPRIFLLSLKAGGVGLNLTRANHVFHFDRWWNPAVENQASDRVFRIGQTRNVQIHKFVCTGTLEERIHEMIESKKALAEQVVGTGENWLTELNTDQLRNLLILDRSAVIEE
ncbi:DEAD/DEAH box helicase [Myxacorys almedinensis]|uniref:DEAD/DEAH box helicase family protein n=1 Tax=Myxacorys almedinensis A TaxID=2690445 RepID=A0A8J7Z1L3_9CYAN|nr:DEAD/DEAH box helicase [Myxacorys almedinensis]NDJ16478.1 DEAD/DEAH box helicase family protein [Myxacorys almedinensis A]